MNEKLKIYKILADTCNSNTCSKGQFKDRCAELCDDCFNRLERIKLTKDLLIALKKSSEDEPGINPNYKPRRIIRASWR